MQLLRLPQAQRSMELTMDAPDTFPLPKLRATQEDAKRVPHDAGRSTGLVMRHGTMELRWFAPKEHDAQVPHDRDELYIVIAGTGMFMRAVESLPFDDISLPIQGEERVPFGPGDALFVAAGTVHRFEDFSDDFASWIVFYGPEGGERRGC